MKKAFLSSLILILFSFNGFTQITSLDLILEFNCETSVYDVKLKILEGSATTVAQRAQFNSQISFVIPTGESIEITERYQPLQNNQTYNGNSPMLWQLGNSTISPAAQPESDFYPVGPNLIPASFYNDLMEGDEVHLFSISVGDSGTYNENVRFFNNGEDPSSSMPGMGGIDYTINFNIGSPINAYNDNILRECTTTNVVNEDLDLTVISPNPASDFVNIDLVNDAKSIKIIDILGNLVKTEGAMNAGSKSISLQNINRGHYYIVIDYDGDVVTKKLVVSE